MSRMKELRVRLSQLPDMPRRIVYLITEDRNFLQELFTEQADLLKTYSDPVFGSRPDLLPQNMYRSCLMDGNLVDLNKEKTPFDFSKYSTAKGKKPPFFFLSDFHLLTEREQAEVIKPFLYFAQERKEEGRDAYLFLLSPVLKLPAGFGQEIEVLDVPEMDQEDVEALLLRAAEETGDPLDGAARKRIAEAVRDFKGVPRWEIQDVLRFLQNDLGSFYGAQHQSMEMAKNIAKSRRELAQTSKRRSARQDSTVTLLESEDAVTGMEEFLDWLADVSPDLTDPQRAYDWGGYPPLGVLFTGLPGSGKTQAAKKAACEMKVSLVQFRMDNLLGGRVGDSQANFKRCRKRVEALAPCVVLIDEIEKIFSKNNRDSSGVKSDLLADLLDWMNNNDKQIFFFATCNSVENLPDELQRDGRFDMRYCCFLPNRAELEKILVFHLKEADIRSKGQRFKNIQDPAHVAKAFLDYAEAQVRQGVPMFFTGANLAALVKKTNRRLRKLWEEERKSEYCYPDDAVYVDVMKQTMESGCSLSYGQTNMHTIVNFWLGALNNSYQSASREMCVPFHAFNRARKKFDTGKLPRYAESSYDALMQKYLVARIEEAFKK